MPAPGVGTLLLARAEWRRLMEEHHDVLVVGGGIHGAGVARDAALRGLRVALIERDDWASGTSSRSSKLFHGGLRYLGQGSLSLVREALVERERHLRLAPRSVRPLRFLIPSVPARGGIPRWQLRVGVALYGLLAGSRNRVHPWDREPSYVDAMVDDARFCLEVVLDARRQGALALSYVEWLEWIRQGDRVVGARLRDRFTGVEGVATATAFVNAAGPWADLLAGAGRREPLLRLTRGTHVILDRRVDHDARLFFAPQDGRVLFLLPYGERHSLLATTDLDDPAPTKDPIPQPDEIRYLRDAFRAAFPDWGRWGAVGLMCGLRPLLASPGSPSSVTREERLLEDASGNLVSILGGKYTTFRATAERTVDRLELKLGRAPGLRPTRTEPLPERPREREGHAAVRRAFVEEDAVRIEDVFLRRTPLGHVGEVDPELLQHAAQLWRLRWGKGEKEARGEMEAFHLLQERRLAPLAAWTA